MSPPTKEHHQEKIQQL